MANQNEIMEDLRPTLVQGNPSYGKITSDIMSPLEGKPTKIWWQLLAISATVLAFGALCLCWEVARGVGTWGENKTVGWAFDITNMVFWIGIGHAGTLISAILLLFRQKWRMSINRAAEAMTIFAVICAIIFPIFHTGRPWIAIVWLFPLPNLRGPLWVNFNSPLMWDVFAISTYFTVSCVFWYIGLIPDLATVRDRAKNKIAKFIYGVLSWGWNGSAKTWARYEILCLLLAGLSTPLVLSVHSVVSFDFATSVMPGWHTTIFPPYFVAGAIFSGFAMVMTLLLLTRPALKLEKYITQVHLEAMMKVILATGMMVGLAYATEFFIAWYSASPWEMFIFINRAFGPYWWSYWTMVSCNVIFPQLFWFKKIRQNLTIVFILTIIVNIGMWFERFVIIVTSLHRDFLPSSWAMYKPTIIEVGILMGTFGLFFTLYLLFVKFFPVIATAEIKSIAKSEGH